MALPDPTTLSDATRFRPAHFRTHSRSPSRSPVRKARFTSQHLDPLLSNLSPESTLKALQETETIPKGSGSTKDVLARSISDASKEEREVGIRAAFAAQKLKEWRRDLSSWYWPSRHQRGYGAGFLPPHEGQDLNHDSTQDVYIGCLPLRTLNEYDEKLEDIKDGLESLEMDDLKDHVLTAHATNSPPPTVRTTGAGVRGSYGRMRDFTALITATVIQALPDLARLNAMIDSWDVRIAILRDLPLLLDTIATTKETLKKAVASCHNPNLSADLTQNDVKRINGALGAQLKSLGRSIDKMLNLLEGQEDALPQSWIDQLEGMELEYATWKEEAARLAERNAASTTSKHIMSEHDVRDNAQSPTTPTLLQAKTSLKVPGHHGHRREISEVSIADSVLSDMSVGEVVDARKSQIFFSPNVQLVDSKPSSPSRPPALQRASTASIEVVSNSQLKRLDVRRSMSADMLAKMSMNGQTSPRSPGGYDVEEADPTTPLAELDAPDSALLTSRRKSTPAMPSPSLMVAPLKVQTHLAAGNGHGVPHVPRKSSKRASFGATTALSPVPSESIVSSVSPSDSLRQAPVSPVSPSKARGEGANLDSRIQDILEKLPSRIRLGDGTSNHLQNSSNGLSRSSTPTPALIPEITKTSRKRAADPDIRVYHLHQNGQGRDLKPIKLFVRAVGENGERVMVRVGGGWADLAEYLREYSAHHGSRGQSENMLEVAQYPVKNDRNRKATSQIISHTQPKQSSSAALRSRSRSLSNSSSGSRSRSPSPPPANVNAPPPVPPIPASYTMHGPIMTVSTNANGETETTFEDGDPTTTLDAKGRKSLEPEAGPYSRSSALHVPGISTTTSIQSPAAIDPAKYVPLGGAGPKGSKSRSATYGAVARTDTDAWVEGMVDRAREVSSQTIHGPTITTTTSVSTSTPASRRVSGVVGPQERSSPRATEKVSGAPQKSSPSAAEKVSTAPQKSSPSATEKVSTTPQKPGEDLDRRKSRLGLGEMSGIKRVFLRKKSTK